MLSFKRTKNLGTILRKSCLTKVAQKCFHKKCSHLGICRGISYEKYRISAAFQNSVIVFHMTFSVFNPRIYKYSVYYYQVISDSNVKYTRFVSSRNFCNGSEIFEGVDLPITMLITNDIMKNIQMSAKICFPLFFPKHIFKLQNRLITESCYYYSFSFEKKESSFRGKEPWPRRDQNSQRKNLFL